MDLSWQHGAAKHCSEDSRSWAILTTYSDARMCTLIPHVSIRWQERQLKARQSAGPTQVLTTVPGCLGTRAHRAHIGRSRALRPAPRTTSSGTCVGPGRKPWDDRDFSARCQTPKNPFTDTQCCMGGAKPPVKAGKWGGLAAPLLNLGTVQVAAKQAASRRAELHRMGGRTSCLWGV